MFKNYQFSLFTTVFTLTLAVLMLVASRWQWHRYLEKQELVATYAEHSTTKAVVINAASLDSKSIADKYRYRKIQVSGTWDFSHQMVIINRMHKSGPGYELLTPLHLDSSDFALIVSRGFIPFADREPDSWHKYDIAEPKATLEGVVQASVSKGLFSPGNPAVNPNGQWVSKWLFPELDLMAKQFPYPVVDTFYLQQIHTGESHDFPAQNISIEVPPSTHYWYTYEWIVLALCTLSIGFSVQAFPHLFNRQQIDNSRTTDV